MYIIGLATCILYVALEYNAQSPDEAALVSAARNFGYVFLVTTVAILILIPVNYDLGLWQQNITSELRTMFKGVC